ncbi:MAG: hypothetical protein ACTHM6_06995 [Tepidisphaeraceae bacterium]
MITLDAGNVLLKPSHRKQLMARLRRAIRIGDRLGDFVLKIVLRRSGRHVEVSAQVHDRHGDFSFRTRQMTLADAVYATARGLSTRLHQQAIGRLAPATA